MTEAPPDLPEVDFDKDVELEYYVDYWDGPIKGMGRCQGKRVWFDLLAEHYSGPEGEKRTRTFVLYEPTPEQELEHDYWHREFVAHVRDGKTLRPPAQQDDFYKRYEEARKTFKPFTIQQARWRAIERTPIG